MQSAPCTMRQGARVSCFGLKIKIDGFSRFDLQTRGFGFSGQDLKTGRYGLMIWASKSRRRFLGLSFKTKWATIYWLHHKTDRKMKMAQDTHRDLVACFVWKQVGVGFLSLTSRLADVLHRWCTWHHHGGRVEIKLKTDVSMRWAVSDSATPTLLFSLYYDIGTF
jgi:hypothetical protein